MTRLLIVGVAVADYVFYVSAFPNAADKYRASDAKVVGGGCAANAAVAAARLGCETFLSSRLGSDAVGDMILSDLSKEGVNVDLCDRSGARSSYSSILINDEGERQIVNFRGSGLIETTGHFSNSGGFDAILADTRWSAGAKAAMEMAARQNIPGVLDIEALANTDAFSTASHLAFSVQGLKHLYPDDPLDQAIARVHETYGGWVCVTMGAEGVLYHDAGGAGHVESFKVAAVDTLGAGDIWHGAFTLALGAGLNELDAVRHANAAAAIKCTRRGGREGSPTRAETEEFMKERASWT